MKTIANEGPMRYIKTLATYFLASFPSYGSLLPSESMGTVESAGTVDVVIVVVVSILSGAGSSDSSSTS